MKTIVALVDGQYRVGFESPQGWVCVSLGGRETAHSFWRQLETALYEFSGNPVTSNDPAYDADDDVANPPA